MNDVYVGNFFDRTPDMRSFLASDMLEFTSLVGLEFEIEGVTFDTVLRNCPSEVYKWWAFKEDGSLRGPHFEAVLRQPLAGYDLSQAILLLTEYLSQYEDRMRTGFRTSTHVHVDVRDLTPVQLAKMFLLYIVFEQPFFTYVGEQRKNNNYCMPSANATELLSGIIGLYSGNYDHFFDCMSTQSRYNAVNLQALRDYGSLEFRQHPGTYNREDIFTWVNMILCLKRWAVESEPEPNNFPEYLSAIGPPALAEEVFGNLASELLGESFISDCYYGIRRVQDIIYSNYMQKYGRSILAELEDDTETTTPISRFQERYREEAPAEQEVDLNLEQEHELFRERVAQRDHQEF